jgi:hypothetical protein
MTTVKEFKDLGVEMHCSDKVQWRHGNQVGVISFAWRPLNTLPDNPKFEYEVDIDAHSWRPLLDQSKNIRVGVMSNGDEVELVAANDDKPVFTQAMADIEYELSLHKANSDLLASLTDFMVKNGIGRIGESCIDVAIRELSEKFNIDQRTPKQKAVDELDAHLNDIQCIKSSTQRHAVAVILINLGYEKK